MKSYLSLTLSSCVAISIFGSVAGSEVTVSDVGQLRRAVAEAGPGTTILIAPGDYAGGNGFRGLRGEPGSPITIRAADAAHPPVFQGGAFAFQLSSVAHVELRGLVLTGATDNGLNIDDGGDFDKPSHHVTLRGLVVRDVGPGGNHDGIKLSGIDDFRVEGCTLERWGGGGSGIDMVVCHRGEIQDCVFRHEGAAGANGVQAKGGTANVAIRRCRFENAGGRAINLGGSTGLAFFRPRPQGYEAKDLVVEDCMFLGSEAPVAFVGVDGAVVRHNTIYGPKRWAFRILQETREPGFVSCRNGRFTDNLIAFRSDEMTTPINIGPDTAPETFTLARNAWYCLDDPGHSRLKFPIAETEGVHGVDPQFQDAEKGDLRLRPESPSRRFGVREKAGPTEKSGR